MSDDYVSYRELELDLGASGSAGTNSEIGDRTRPPGNGATRHQEPHIGYGQPSRPPGPRFFVRPGASQPPASEGAHYSARPIQPASRPVEAPAAPEGQLPRRATRSQPLRTLRLLAFNADLRPSIALSDGLLEGSKYAEDRFDGLVEALKAQDADVVVLQEIYDLGQVDRLRQVFRNRYPNVAIKAPSRDAKLGCGHVILSNRPFADMRFEPLKGGPEPRGLIEKGMLITRLSLPGGAIRIVALQGCSSGMPERMMRDDTAGKRDKFARRVLRQLQMEDEGETLLVVGDLSSGPEHRPELHGMLSRGGFSDAIERADIAMRVTGHPGAAAPARPDWRPQFFARVPEWSGVFFTGWRTVFDHATVQVAHGVRKPIANRPALELTLEMEQR